MHKFDICPIEQSYTGIRDLMFDNVRFMYKIVRTVLLMIIWTSAHSFRTIVNSRKNLLPYICCQKK